MGPVEISQPTLAGMPRVRARRPAHVPAAAASRPVARVCVDVQPAHLDRLFDYLVPAELDEAAQPGVRVKVRFGGQDVDGWLLSRHDDTDHDGHLAPLRRVVTHEPVLTPEVARLARAVADHYAGTLADVLRLAVPPRHARVETEMADPVVAAEGPGASVPPAPVAVATAWQPYRGGAAFLRHVLAGGHPRAVWAALPGPQGERWEDAIAQAVVACVLGGRGALVVAPDARDVDRVLAGLARVGIPATASGGLREPAGTVLAVRLTADEGPAARYRGFLAARRGRARVVVGTRASMFAPVAELGLVVLWEDGDPLHAEPRAPYPHARQVLTLRAELAGCAALVGGFGRTVEAQRLIETHWAREVAADRATVRIRTARVRALTTVELAKEGAAAAARLPAPVFAAMRAALATGPVLVQVPRTGYLPVTACARCRAPARCAACTGPLGVDAADAVACCRWCGRLATDWACRECGGRGLRSVRVGSGRTAEEIGRAFPGVTVRTSGARTTTGVLDVVPDRPAIVVATPGAEPVAESGYAVAVLLDAAVATAGEGLAVEPDALRRWLAAAALVRPADQGGQVLLVGDGAGRPTQALVRWDPAGLAERELAERTALRLPPAVAMAAVTGPRQAVELVVGRVAAPGLAVLGPVPVTGATSASGVGSSSATRSGTRSGTRSAPGARTASVPATLDPDVRTLLRVAPQTASALATSLAQSLAVRSARREGGALRAQVDPPEVL